MLRFSCVVTACACCAVGPLLRSSHDGVAHCFASLALQKRRRSLRVACHMTALLIASLLSRCIPHMPVAPSVPSLRSSHDGVAHCFASLASLTTPSVPLLRSSHDGVAHCFASLALQTPARQWQSRFTRRLSSALRRYYLLNAVVVRGPRGLFKQVAVIGCS